MELSLHGACADAWVARLDHSPTDPAHISIPYSIPPCNADDGMNHSYAMEQS